MKLPTMDEMISLRTENVLMREHIDRVRKLYEGIMEQREEIITAFLAKYNLEPKDVVQITQPQMDGTMRWWVERKEKPHD